MSEIKVRATLSLPDDCKPEDADEKAEEAVLEFVKALAQRRARVDAEAFGGASSFSLTDDTEATLDAEAIINDLKKNTQGTEK